MNQISATSGSPQTAFNKLTSKEKMLILAIPIPVFHIVYFILLLRKGRFTKSGEFWKYVSWSYVIYTAFLFLLLLVKGTA
jgi:hypothetical protein